VGNDARLIRHPEGRIELTGSLIRVDVLTRRATAPPAPTPKK
jgi:hypothetical protein